MRRALLIASLLIPAWHHVAAACDEDDNDAAEAAEPEEPDEAGEPDEPADTGLEGRVDALEARVATLEQERGNAPDKEAADADDGFDIDVDVDVEID
jgi:hypothetical protein